jgi:hypothetical protein
MKSGLLRRLAQNDAPASYDPELHKEVGAGSYLTAKGRIFSLVIAKNACRTCKFFHVNGHEITRASVNVFFFLLLSCRLKFCLERLKTQMQFLLVGGGPM